jgi:hypothetical protein
MADNAGGAAAPTIFTTPIFRVSYPNLDKPSKMEGSDGEPKFGITGLFTAASFTPQDAERWKALRIGSVVALREKFAEKAFGPDKKIIPSYKMPFHDGNEKPNTDGYGAGVTFFRMANKNPPGIARVSGGVKTKIDWSEIYAGCYARASISFWAYDNKSKGVAVNLHNVLWIGDGTRFGNAGPSVENDFTDLSEEEVGFDDPLASASAELSDDEIAF